MVYGSKTWAMNADRDEDVMMDACKGQILKFHSKAKNVLGHCLIISLS